MTPANPPDPDIAARIITQDPKTYAVTSASHPVADNFASSVNPAFAHSPPPHDPAKSDEERAIEEAIRLSLRNEIQKASKVQSRPKADVPDDLVFSVNNEFDILDEPDGDTIIYIGPPPKMPEQSDKEYRYIDNHFGQVHVVQSTTLRQMGKSSKFNDDDLLGPKSVRSERKLRRLGVLAKAEAKRGQKFKYHIDLRPPNEDEEAIILVTELTCTKGVLTWHLARDKYGLPAAMVLGYDGYGFPTHVLNDSSAPGAPNTANEAAKVTNVSQSISTNVSSDKDTAPWAEAPPSKIEPEYSPIRHRCAIERLLHAIHGHDPKLDSAPKAWTYFAVARLFGCAHHERISRWIKDWIYDINNQNFIQTNPEVAYRIGMGIRSPSLLKDAFSILVGERTLISVYGDLNPDILSPLVRSVHGRKLELLDDDERNRIDHAADSFVTRIRGNVQHIFRDMGWLRKSVAYAILDDIVGETPEEDELLESTKNLIKEYIRSRMLYVLCQDQATCSELEGAPKSTLPFRSSTGELYHSVYNRLKHPMRLFTKTFWLALQNTVFGRDPNNTTHEGSVGTATSAFHIDGLCELYPDDTDLEIKTIKRDALVAKIAAVNRLLRRRKFPEEAPLDLPGSFEVLPERIAKPRSFCAVASDSSEYNTQNVGSSFPDASPPKRRKTLGTNIIPHDVPVASGANIPSASQEKSPVKLPDKSGLTSYGNPAPPMPALVQPALAIQPKQKGVLDQVKGYVQHHLCRGKAAGDEEEEPLMSEIQDLIVAGPALHDASTAESSSESTTAEAKEEAAPEMQYNPWTGAWEDWGAQSKSSVMAWTDDDPPPPPRPGDRDRDMSIWESLNEEQARIHTPVNMNPIPVDPGHIPINPTALFNHVGNEVFNICSGILYPPHLFHQPGLLPTDLFDNLLCLDANEFRYLPLWAGGLDDGTGGVFDECPVPNLDTLSSKYEPFAAGRIRGPHEGRDTDSESFTDIASQAISTVGKASKLATDGTETVKSLSTISVGESARGDGDRDGDNVVLNDRDGHSSVVAGLRNIDISQSHNTDTDMDMDSDTEMGASSSGDDDFSTGSTVDNNNNDDDEPKDDHGNDTDGDDEMSATTAQSSSTTMTSTTAPPAERDVMGDFDLL